MSFPGRGKNGPVFWAQKIYTFDSVKHRDPCDVNMELMKLTSDFVDTDSKETNQLIN